MWRRVWSTTCTSITNNGGRVIKGEVSSSSSSLSSSSSSSLSSPSMMMNWVRFMSRKRAENLRKINPKVPYSEAFSIAQNLFNVIQHRGPQTIGSAWTNAQEAGISGLNSKTHLKLLLKWMRGKKMLKQICQSDGSHKKFLLCTPQDAPAAQAAAAEAARVKSQTVKSKKLRKKK